jgi:MFS family permease
VTITRNHRSILSSPGAPALLASSVIARLPLAMFSIALLVNARRVTGSFAAAGIVSGAYALSSAFSAPLAGRLVDRFGQTMVLIGGATVTALVLIGTGLIPPGAPPGVLVALAAATGLATPPLEACIRTLLPVIADDPKRLPALFACESTVLELTFVFGPPLALGLGSIWSTGAALAVSGVVMLAGTLVFAAQPASRRWRPDHATDVPRGGSLGSPAIRTLVLVLVGTGTVFGATEVGVTAAVRALGSTVAGGPLLALWGLGSLLGGIVATRLGGGARRATGLVVLLAALAAGHGALAFTTGSLIAIGLVILLAGATIAPTEATISAMVDGAAPDGARTEAFSWLFTASLSGAALGAAVAGGLAQSAGAPGAFAFAGFAGVLTVAVAAIGARAIDRGTGLRPESIAAPACAT